jgi:hypothetical protein
MKTVIYKQTIIAKQLNRKKMVGLALLIVE